MITTLSSLINAAVPGLTPGTNVQRPLSASSTKRPLAGSIARACYALVSGNQSTTFAGGLVYYDKYFNPVVADRSQEATAGLGAANGNIQQLLASGDAQQWQSILCNMTDTSVVPNSSALQYNAAQCFNSGEFGNALVDPFSNSTATGIYGRYGSGTVKQLLNAAFVNSDHSNKAIVYTLSGGAFNANARVDGVINYSYIGTQPYTIPGVNTSMLGSASYDAATNTLVILSYTAAAGQFNLITYQGLNLNAFPSPALAFTQPGIVITTKAIVFTPSWSVSDAESAYQIKPILCDNGSVYVSVMFTSVGLALYLITGGTTVPVVTYIGLKALSSQAYGAGQGASYGQRQLQSRDGGAVISYCTYYYYGAGVVTWVIDKRNSTYTVSTVLDYANTSQGANILPYGDSGFAMYICGNTYATNYVGTVQAAMERNGVGGLLGQRKGNFYLPYFPQPNTTNYPAMTQVTDYAMLDDEYLV